MTQMRYVYQVNKERLWAEKGYDRLALYNAECARGIVHTPEYDAEMAQIQQRFNDERA